jgi:hypothetical protein
LQACFLFLKNLAKIRKRKKEKEKVQEKRKTSLKQVF